MSTNSITQGEQVGVLWSWMLAEGMHIQFAHRTFQWSNEARGVAAVHCVIVGFGLEDRDGKRIYDYRDIRGEPTAITAKQINPYLVDAPQVVVGNSKAPICAVPEIRFGSMPNDGGYLLLSPDERKQLLRDEPAASEWLRPFLGAEEFLNGGERWCLWLPNIEPSDLRALPEIRNRVQNVKKAREASKRPTTRKLAETPTLFGEIRQPLQDYLAIPEVSSERRVYVPAGFLSKKVIASNKLYTLAGATLFEFGLLSSRQHTAWLRTVGGKLKSDFQYSAGIVYNNFPWPVDATEAQRAAIEKAAQAVLDARAAHPGSTLADLYDPLTMPANLLKAHQELDRAVDAAYGRKGFSGDAERVAFLFEQYQRLTSLLPAEGSKPKRAAKAKAS